MSWDSYTNDLMKKNGDISKCAIVGLDGNVWAKSPGFEMTPSELVTAIDGLSATKGTLQANGVYVCGNKFICLRADDDCCQAKSPSGGLSIVKAKTCVLVGIYEGAGQEKGGGVYDTLHKMRDYLLSMNF